MTFDVIVRGVPWDPDRADLAHELALDLGGRIIWDQKRDSVDTFLRAITAQPDRGVLHLEDDVQPTTDLLGKARAVIDSDPEEVVQFYSNRAADLTVGSRREPGRTFLMTQCFYLPPDLGPAIAAFCPGWLQSKEGREHPTEYDRMMAAYLQSQRMTYWLSVPSLVQHHRWRSAINPRRTSVRQSRTFQL
jgi:hypothetical protein